MPLESTIRKPATVTTRWSGTEPQDINKSGVLARRAAANYSLTPKQPADMLF